MTEPLNDCGAASRTWNWIYDRVIDGGSALRASLHTSKEWRVQVEPAFNVAGERRMTARWFDVNDRITLEQTGWIQPPGEIGINNPWYPGPDIETHHFSYDENGQKSSYTDPLGRVTNYGYDNRNRPSTTTEYPVPVPGATSAPRTTTTQYNAAGDKILVTFPDQRTQQWPTDDYTAFGQPRTFIDERGNTTNMEYWQWGPMKKLATVTTHRTKDDPGPKENQLTSFDYDPMGRPTKTTFPELKVTCYDMTVTSKQVATTANGKERTPEAIGATKEHENLHTSDIRCEIRKPTRCREPKRRRRPQAILHNHILSVRKPSNIEGSKWKFRRNLESSSKCISRSDGTLFCEVILFCCIAQSNNRCRNQRQTPSVM
jgi:YD repeat-containing protein